MTFRASIITLYPEMFPGPLGMSLAGNALERGDCSIETCHLREFGTGKHRNVDDTPAGGGAGMVLKPDVLANAIDSVSGAGDNRPRLLMSPRGKPLTQTMVREFSQGEGLVIVCGRFEGVDERVIGARNLTEISIGDYILSGGEPAALVLLDAVIRLLPGVMGNDQSGTHESFENGLLEHPHYTRPQIWEEREIPPVLTSGNHGAIEKWQREQSERLTAERRPDLAEKIPGSGPRAREIIPALPVTNLGQGVDFYRERLGFECMYRDEGGYAVMRWQAVELHLWLANDESWRERQEGLPVQSGAESFIAGTHSCRIMVSGVEALWEKYRNTDMIHPKGHLEKKPWGSTEFAILDPWGNLITFHEWL